jgi:pimeloyl-ACP methyl ester carboxylesterase
MHRTFPVRHGYVEHAGLRLHHLDYGGEGAPLVLLHGVTGHAWIWHDVAPQLTRFGRVIAVDLRGFGDSQWSPAQAYTTVDHATDLGALLAAARGGPATLIGSSWGALVAIAFAYRRPEQVRRVAILDVEPSFTQAETDVVPRPRSFASHADAVAHERGANPHAPDALLHIVAAGGTRPEMSGALVPKHDPFFFERWPFRGDDWWEALPTVAAPTLVVHAGASFVRREVTEHMASLIPGARHVEVAGRAHVLPLDAPAAVTDLLVGFLAAGAGAA